MRSVTLLRLALGLLAVDSTVAGPCIPVGTTTTAVTSSASTETSYETAQSSTSVASATSSVTSETSVETSSTVSVETSASSTASTETSMSSTATETSASSATETTISSATTDSTTTTSDMTTSTTSAAPTITFDIIAAGSGPVQGMSLQTYNSADSVALFKNEIGGGSSVQPFHLDSQGRLINDQGYYLCGYYDANNDDLDAPAEVGTCDGEYPLGNAFLRCQQTADFKLTCSIPAITCVATGDPNDPFSLPDCQAAAGTWNNLYTAESGPGVVPFIGPANAGSDYYSSVEFGIQVV